MISKKISAVAIALAAPAIMVAAPSIANAETTLNVSGSLRGEIRYTVSSTEATSCSVEATKRDGTQVQGGGFVVAPGLPYSGQLTGLPGGTWTVVVTCANGDNAFRTVFVLALL